MIPRSAAPKRPPSVPKKAKLGDVTLEFTSLLWAVDHGLQSMSKRMKNELGVTGPQRVVVRMVGENPGISAGVLASLLKLHPSTLTGVLDRLVTRGVLQRVTDPADRRRALFSLTPLGQLFNHLKDGTVESAVRKALERIEPEDLRVAKEVLNVIVEQLSP